MCSPIRFVASCVCLLGSYPLISFAVESRCVEKKGVLLESFAVCLEQTLSDGKAIVGKVDVDANQEFAAKYGVRNIPTVLIFKNGEVVDKQVGVAPKNVYTGKIDAAI